MSKFNRGRLVLVAIVTILTLVVSPIQAKSNRSKPVAQFKIGKKTFKFKQRHFDAEVSNVQGDFNFSFVSSKPKRTAGVIFEFDDLGLDEKEYRLVGPGNFQEKSGDVVVTVGQSKGDSFKGSSFASTNSSSATGSLTITNIDRENQTVMGEFNFTTNVEFSKFRNNQEKTRNKEVTVKQGQFKASFEGIGREFFLEDQDFFNSNNSFLPNNKADANNGNEAAVANNAAGKFQINDTIFFYGANDVSSSIDRSFTIVDLNIESQPGANEEYRSILRFYFRTKQIADATRFEIGSITSFNGAAFNNRLVVAAVLVQEYSNPEIGIEQIKLATAESVPNIDGDLFINSYDPNTGIMSAIFNFDTELDFIHINSEGLVKGPYQRTVSIENGSFTVNVKDEAN